MPFSRQIRILSILLLLAVVAPAWALHRGYYNHPDIHGDTIIFNSEDDLWSVPAEGGIATRLTSDPGLETFPRISPDGTHVAFAGQYDGNLDVYVMPIEGGEPKRLTWHPYSDLPSDWTPDGKEVLVFTARSHPFYDRETYIVPADGGVPQKYPIGAASYAVLAPDGKTVAFNRNYVQPRTWKRYGGGLADDIWIGNVETGEFEKLTEYFGNDLTPMFVGDRLYFLSERDGRLNLWSMTPKGKDLQQHTKMKDFDVRNPQTDGVRRVVFQYGADIWLYDSKTDEAHLVDIQLPTDRAQTRPFFPKVSDFIEDYAVTNDGKKTVEALRGDLFNIPAKYGRTIPLTSTKGARETRVTFAGKDDEYVVYYSDKSGNYEIYRADARTGENETALRSEGDLDRGYIEPFYPIVVSPGGEKAAYADQTGTLYWTGVTTPTLHRIDRDDYWEISDYEWSPDDRYLAYSKYEANQYQRLYIYDTESDESKPVSAGFYDSFSPAWSRDGKYLFYLSSRSFNRMDGAYEATSFMIDPTRIYAILLTGDSENPFYKKDPYEEDDDAEKKEEEDKKKEDENKPTPTTNDTATSDTVTAAGGKDDKKDEDKEKPPEVKIDFDGILDRQIVFPVESGNLGGLLAAKDKVFFFRTDEGATNLQTFNYPAEDAEEKTFAADVSGYAMSRNGEQIIYRAGNRLGVAAASAGASGPEDNSPDLSSARMIVEPEAEWKQILTEAFRYNRDFFYAPDMAGVNWDAVLKTYAPLIDRISVRGELTAILSNFVAELGHGHTYVMGDGDAPEGRTIPTGLLGVDFGVDKDHDLVTLKRIYRGERWDDRLQSPFNTRQTAEIKDGWYLLKVNGKPVTTDVDPLFHFWGMDGGDEVQLTIAPDAEGKDAKDYRITLLKEDTALREYAFIKANRDYVSEQSDGKIGYVYLPDMGTDGLVSFFREFYAQLDKEAMVIDIRWNGGGNVSQKLIRRLNQKLYAYTLARNFPKPSTYPERVFTGPLACLINDRAGSDGDIFARSFRDFKLGPLIGERTWGGTVGIRSHTRMVDGSRITVPEFAFVDPERGFEIENHGVAPDKGFEVPLRPEDELTGHDPQLDRAIEYLKKEMKEKKYQRFPVPDKFPDRSVESFRERSEGWMKKP